jgi:hypothetical protein
MLLDKDNPDAAKAKSAAIAIGADNIEDHGADNGATMVNNGVTYYKLNESFFA